MCTNLQAEQLHFLTPKYCVHASSSLAMIGLLQHCYMSGTLSGGCQQLQSE
jgi:hypothetical protein